jgi:hypothetical protein
MRRGGGIGGGWQEGWAGKSSRKIYAEDYEVRLRGLKRRDANEG